MSEENKTTTANKGPEAKKTSSDKPQNRGRGRRRGGNSRRREPKEFEEAILDIARVTRVTKGGRQLRFRVLVVIGDKKGRVGFGLGKSSEVIGGIQKAVSEAKRRLITVPMVNGTIPHEVHQKFKASFVNLYPAPEGRGVIAGGALRKMLELAGIKNVLSKLHGSRNRVVSTYCAYNALKSLTTDPSPLMMSKTTEEEEKTAEEVTVTENAS